jgi:hypothetical protein
MDTLQLTGGANLDLTQVSNVGAGGVGGLSRIASIERIDLSTDTSANTLTLALKDVIDMSGMNLFNTSNGWTNSSGTPLGAAVARHQLMVLGSAGDVIVASGGWTSVGQATHVDAGTTHTYEIYNSSVGTYAQLLVDATITRTGIV